MSTKKFKTNVQIEADLLLPNKTVGRALVNNGSGQLDVSVVTEAELALLSGISSNVQTQLDAKIDSSEKGAANGVATLDANSKIPSAQIPALAITEVFVVADITARDALTIGSGDGEVQEGDVVKVTDASADPNVTSGPASYIYDGSAYVRLNVDDQVLSVNGQTGAVSLDSDDISEGVTNLYYTEARFDASFAGKDTDDLSEGATNLYYTDARFDTRLATKTTDNLTEGATNLYYTAERAQDDVGGALTDSASIDFTYDDGAGTITAVVLPAGVDHDSLSGFVANEHIDWTVDAGVDIADANISETSVTQHEAAIDHDALTNFVTNEHVDHSAVEIQTLTNSGLSGGGDITTTRSIELSPTNLPAVAAADDADQIIIYDNSGGIVAKQTRANFLAGVGAGSAGDISETTFAFADNQVAAANVTGLAFANGTVRGFTAEIVIERGTTYEKYKLEGIQRNADWQMSQEAVGDDTGLTFSITTSGQVQYTSSSTGSGGNIKFRAITLSV